MKKRRLISLMLAGAMTTSIGLLSGCDDGSLYSNENVYIVLEQNEVDILHRGNVKEIFVDGIYAGGPATHYQFSFDCGEKTKTNTKHQIFEKEPKTERYDEKCEECFGHD